MVVSFDGAGSVDLWEHWRSVARDTGARFTFFVSGVYFLTAEHGSLYRPPGRAPGTSDIGFLPVPAGAVPSDYEAALLAQMSAGHEEGHEIASHFNGHFCGRGGVSTWTAGDWASELDGFFALLGGASTNNGIEPPVALSFSSIDVVGARTPCLEGDMSALYPVLRSRQMRYDASQTAALGDWPTRQGGIWSFPLASITLAGTSRSVLSMDYNLYVNQTGPGIEEQAYRTFQGYIDASYRGNRAPVSIGSHFARWNGGAYVRAITRLVERNCRRPEIRCVTFNELADWLDSQPRPVGLSR